MFLSHFEKIVTDITALQPQLTPDLSTGDFLAALHKIDDLREQIHRLNGFAYLSFAEDTQNQEVQNFLSQIRQVIAESQNRTLFFELWWKKKYL